ncbi:hypothetical protein MKZ23_08830 [Paenibacillus sp. FSL R5-0876]|uniref:hypothetical protein n=1 Tax=Paenibacillus sp. FSL R5-0876 TaxID=2921661 RepID=UPI0030FB8D66
MNSIESLNPWNIDFLNIWPQLHIVAKIISEASTAGVGLSTSQKVVRAKIEDMIDQIAEKRELETPKRARKDSK